MLLQSNSAAAKGNETTYDIRLDELQCAIK